MQKWKSRVKKVRCKIFREKKNFLGRTWSVIKTLEFSSLLLQVLRIASDKVGLLCNYKNFAYEERLTKKRAEKRQLYLNFSILALVFLPFFLRTYTQSWKGGWILFISGLDCFCRGIVCWKLWNIFACAKISIRGCASSFVVIVDLSHDQNREP